MRDKGWDMTRAATGMRISQAAIIGPRILSPEPASERSAGRRAPTKLQLPIGEPDLTAIRDVISNLLVPLLIKEFMAEYNAKPATEANQSQQTSVPHKGRKTRHAER